MKLLIVEDEATLAADVDAFLSEGGMTCTLVPTFEEAQEAIALYSYDLVLLDLGLPDGSGLKLIPMLTILDQAPGILIISAKHSLDDKLAGLDLGADDYITKPFHLAELQSRIHSVFRRKKFQGRTSLRIGAIEIFPSEQRILVQGQDVPLTVKEFQLLLYFAGNCGRVLSKGAIAEHLWGDRADMLDDFDFIYSHIKHLRKKLVQAGAADRIKSVYGVGYKFDCS